MRPSLVSLLGSALLAGLVFLAAFQNESDLEAWGARHAGDRPGADHHAGCVLCQVSRPGLPEVVGENVRVLDAREADADEADARD